MSGELEEKASAYFLLSRLFREAPDLSFLKAIVQEKLITLAGDFFEGTDGEEKFHEETYWPRRVEEIAVEYAALFVVPGDCYIPPYESYYCDTLSIDHSTASSPYFEPQPLPEGMKGFIGGRSSVEARKFYEESGFVLSPDFYDLPDHIACELEFLGRSYQEGKADLAGGFFQIHLGRWVFTFLERLEKQKRSLFYQKVAASLNPFLRQEANALLLKH